MANSTSTECIVGVYGFFVITLLLGIHHLSYTAGLDIWRFTSVWTCNLLGYLSRVAVLTACVVNSCVISSVKAYRWWKGGCYATSNFNIIYLWFVKQSMWPFFTLARCIQRLWINSELLVLLRNSRCHKHWSRSAYKCFFQMFETFS